jgi:hypothetical protein
VKRSGFNEIRDTNDEIRPEPFKGEEMHVLSRRDVRDERERRDWREGCWLHAPIVTSGITGPDWDAEGDAREFFDRSPRQSTHSIVRQLRFGKLPGFAG